MYTKEKWQLTKDGVWKGMLLARGLSNNKQYVKFMKVFSLTKTH